MGQAWVMVHLCRGWDVEGVLGAFGGWGPAELTPEERSGLVR